MKCWVLGFFAATLAVPLQAAIITEQYDFTLPSASGIYSAGHKFQITATYDNTGTVMSVWFDGANGIAQFGSGDDTLDFEQTLSQFPPNTLFISDASIAVAGLQWPAGATPLDVSNRNASRVTAFKNPATDGVIYIDLFADAVQMMFQTTGPFYSQYYPEGLTAFYLGQSFVDESGNLGTSNVEVSFEPRTVPVRVTVVPEPPILALIGLGLAGFGLARRRNRQKSTV